MNLTDTNYLEKIKLIRYLILDEVRFRNVENQQFEKKNPKREKI